jgi:hypothetical protein
MMRTDTTRPQGIEDGEDELSLLQAEASVRFSAKQCPPFFRMKIGGIPRALPPAVLDPWALMKTTVPGASAIVLVGLRLEDAHERARRLNEPGRPDGFHLWS